MREAHLEVCEGRGPSGGRINTEGEIFKGILLRGGEAKTLTYFCLCEIRQEGKRPKKKRPQKEHFAD